MSQPTTTTPPQPSPPPHCRLAVLQSNAILYNLQANITTITDALQALVSNSELEVELLVCPELFLTGYELAQQEVRNASALRKCAIPADGEVMQQIRDLVIKHRIAISVGYAELSEGEKAADGQAVIYNSSILIDYKGQTVLNYRKTHLWWQDERAAFTPGDQFVVADLTLRSGDTLRTGAIICYDVEFSEACRSISLQSCDLLLVPTALVVQDFIIPLITIRARGHENHMFLAYSNLVGRSRVHYNDKQPNGDSRNDHNSANELSKNNFIGLSAVIDPAGGECARAPISETVASQLPKDLVYPFDHRAKQHANSRTIHLKTTAVTGTDSPVLIVSDINLAAYEGSFKDIDYLVDRRHELFDRVGRAAQPRKAVAGSQQPNVLLNGHSVSNETAQ